MGKSDPYKDRPKLPSREQIISDLSTASDNDVAFKEIEGSQVVRQTGPEREQNDGNGADSPDQETIDTNYQHVTRLLELETQLKKEPDQLQEKYEQLEKLGQDVSSSITELKSAAELMLKKS